LGEDVRKSKYIYVQFVVLELEIIYKSKTFLLKSISLAFVRDSIPCLSGSLGLLNVMIGLYITNEFTICQLDIKHLAIQLEHDRGLFPMRSLH